MAADEERAGVGDGTLVPGAPEHLMGSTMADVAAVAGVSSATVSRFLRGQHVRKAEEIAAAIEALDYRPNEAARGLRLRSTGAIAVVVRDIGNPYVASLVAGVQSVAGANRFALYLAGGLEDPEAIVSGISSRVDAIVCAVANDGAVLDALRRSRKPAVLVEFEPSGCDHPFDVVVLNNTDGSRRAVEALIELGHRSLGVLAGPDEISVGRERLAGAALAVERAAEKVELAVERTDFSFASGYAGSERLLERAAPPTAIFASNNLTAMGCLQCLHDRGIEVPAEISFIGFDSLQHPELMCPPPSTVERPEEEQGALAMRLLESRMAGRGPAPPRRIVLDTELTVRGSCGPPPEPNNPESRSGMTDLER